MPDTRDNPIRARLGPQLRARFDAYTAREHRTVTNAVVTLLTQALDTEDARLEHQAHLMARTYAEGKYLPAPDLPPALSDAPGQHNPFINEEPVFDDGGEV